MTAAGERVCVIGAGSSGIAACQVLDARGIEFDCFEVGSQVGGNWRYMNDNGMSSAYRSLHINTSRRTMAYATYPMPDDYPDYPSHWQIAKYFDDYVDHFGFRGRIRFRTEVTGVEPAADGDWRVTWRDLESGEEGSEVYTAVFVANGHHWDARWPEPAYPGQDDFEGEQLHVHDYKTPDTIEGKRVLVLGIGNSATDIAVEASQRAERTLLAMRRGAWILPKYLRGKPVDELGNAFVNRLPLAVTRAMYRRALKTATGEPMDYGLPEPDHKLAEAHPTISAELLLADRPRRHHGEAERRPVRRRADGAVHRRLRGGGRRHRVLHGLQDHVPLLRARADRGPRQRDPAVQARRQPRAPGPLLHRAAAAAGGDHAARRSAVGVDRRRARGQGRAARTRSGWSATSRATARRWPSATSPRSATRSRSTSSRTCDRCAASVRGRRLGLGRA